MQKPAPFIKLIFPILLGLSSFSAQAGVIDSYTAATNDRFTNSASFIAAGFNLSGIGQAADGRWATLISPNVIVSAAHLQPSSVVSFYESNNPNSAVVQRTITSTTVKVGSTDLWLGVLNANVPNSIRSYNFANTFLTGTAPSGGNFPIDNAGVFQNVNAYLIGRSPESFPAFQSQSVGRNRITGYSENVDFLGNLNNDSLILAYDANGSGSYVQYESHVVGGDSGAPLFVENNGDLLLLGTNAFLLNNTNGSVFGSGVNYIGNQSSFVSNFISVNAVPEPNSMCLAGLALVAGCVAKRRRFRRIA